MRLITVPIIVKGREKERPIGRLEAANLLDISPQTLSNYMTRGIGPDAYKIGSAANAPVVYFESDVIAWKNEAMQDLNTRYGRGRAENFGYVNPLGVDTRKDTR